MFTIKATFHLLMKIHGVKVAFLVFLAVTFDGKRMIYIFSQNSTKIVLWHVYFCYDGIYSQLLV
ncbi:hypothetical protein VK72_15000 [Paenibacillus polymyxa]|nr:hypothetical protein VK72_15000 [Paenibacillus polymyxa]